MEQVSSYLNSKSYNKDESQTASVLSPHIGLLGQRPGKLGPINKNTLATNNEHNELNKKKPGHVNGLAYYIRTSVSSKDPSSQDDGQIQGTHTMHCETPLTEQSDGS